MDKQVIKVSISQILDTNTIRRESEEAGLVITFTGISDAQREKVETIFSKSKFGSFRISGNTEYLKYFAKSEISLVKKALQYLTNEGANLEMDEKSVETKDIIKAISHKMLEAEAGWNKDTQINRQTGT